MKLFYFMLFCAVFFTTCNKQQANIENKPTEQLQESQSIASSNNGEIDYEVEKDGNNDEQLENQSIVDNEKEESDYEIEQKKEDNKEVSFEQVDYKKFEPEKLKNGYQVIAEINDSTLKIYGEKKEHVIVLGDVGLVSELKNKYGISFVGGDLYSSMFSHTDYPWTLIGLGLINFPEEEPEYLHYFIFQFQLPDYIQYYEISWYGATFENDKMLWYMQYDKPELIKDENGNFVYRPEGKLYAKDFYQAPPEKSAIHVLDFLWIYSDDSKETLLAKLDRYDIDYQNIIVDGPYDPNSEDEPKHKKVFDKISAIFPYAKNLVLIIHVSYLTSNQPNANGKPYEAYFRIASN